MEALQGEGNMALDKFIRRRNRTAYHYSCRMAAKEDASGGEGVVGPLWKAFGVEGLRAPDSSVPLGDWGVFAGAGGVYC